MASKLNPQKRYLQVALNNTLDEAYKIINELPISDRIIIEAGTPFIKKYGEDGIRQIRLWQEQHIEFWSLLASQKAKKFDFFSAARYLISELNYGVADDEKEKKGGSDILRSLLFGLVKPEEKKEEIAEKIPQAITYREKTNNLFPYIVADLKTMDRAETEVQMAARAGASAAVALGEAPIETLNSFIQECEKNGLDSMIDMMNVDFPLSVLRSLKKIPSVVILHRGADEEKFNKEKTIPLHEIRRIKGNYDIMVSIAGGDTLKEVQRAVFNDADIVVVWKSVFEKTNETIELVNGFLKEIK